MEVSMFTIRVTTLMKGNEPRPKTPPPGFKEEFGLFDTQEEAAETLRLSGWNECQTGWYKDNPKDPKGLDPLAPFWTAQIIDLHNTRPIEGLPGIYDNPSVLTKLATNKN
jgi:hypothetical protein